MPNKFPKKVRRGWVTKRACNGRSDKGEIGGKTATPPPPPHPLPDPCIIGLLLSKYRKYSELDRNANSV